MCVVVWKPVSECVDHHPPLLRDTCCWQVTITRHHQLHNVAKILKEIHMLSSNLTPTSSWGFWSLVSSGRESYQTSMSVLLLAILSANSTWLGRYQLLSALLAHLLVSLMPLDKQPGKQKQRYKKVIHYTGSCRILKKCVGVHACEVD